MVHSIKYKQFILNDQKEIEFVDRTLQLESRRLQLSINFNLSNLIINNIMLEKATPFDEDLSSEEEKPFIGRKRKNDPKELERQNKPEYKKKRIMPKNKRLLHQIWKLETPLTHYHVYNFHNILAINQHSLLDPNCEESFVSSKFYMKQISKVTIDRGCLFFSLENVQGDTTPIPYLCEKLRSLGDAQYFKFAQTMEYVEQTLPEINQKLGSTGISAQQKLNGFLEEMASRPFFSQYSPSLLIISSAFLRLMGYDTEELAIQSIKYKTILQEFFSAQHYTQIIHKHLKNIQMLKDYLEGTMNLDQFCQESTIVCQDYIYTRTNKQIKCNFIGGTSKQLTPYIEIQELDQAAVDGIESSNSRFAAQKEKIERFKLSCKQKEFGLLKSLIPLPKHEDPEFKGKVCTYKEIQTSESVPSQSISSGS